MRLPIGLAIVRGSGVLLVGIGLMVVVFASREVDPWPRAKVGSAIVGLGGSLLIAVYVRTSALRTGHYPRLAQGEAAALPRGRAPGGEAKGKP